jgi:quercetin dioxygenase-like cupin family protein
MRLLPKFITRSKGVTPTPLTRATLGKFEAENNGIEVESQRTSADFALAKVVIEPGGTTGWHHHPGVALVSVNSGAITEYDKNCHKSVIKAGEGFFESNGEVHVVRNRGKANAVLYVTFIAPTKTPADGLVILDPKPNGLSIPYPQEFTLVWAAGALLKEVGPASSGGSATLVVMLGRS